MEGTGDIAHILHGTTELPDNLGGAFSMHTGGQSLVMP
jgi:hypothetical protein